MQESVFKLANEAIPSYVANIYEHANDKGVAASAEEEELVKLTAVSMYGGGSDTVMRFSRRDLARHINIETTFPRWFLFSTTSTSQ